MYFGHFGHFREYFCNVEVLLGIFFKEIFNGILIFFLKFFFKYFSPFEGLNIVLEVLKVLGSF